MKSVYFCHLDFTKAFDLYRELSFLQYFLNKTEKVKLTTYQIVEEEV